MGEDVVAKNLQAAPPTGTKRVMIARPAFSIREPAATMGWSFHKAAIAPGLSAMFHGAYASPSEIPLEPLYLGWSIPVERLTVSEIAELQRHYVTELDARTLDGLDVAIDTLITTVGLIKRLITPKAISDRLETIVAMASAALKLQELLNRPADELSIMADAISLEASVYHHLSSKIEIACINTEDVRSLINECASSISLLKPLVSKRGSKQDLALKLFFRTVTAVMKEGGYKTTLPSNSIKEKDSTAKPTQFTNFVQTILSIVTSKGILSFSHAPVMMPDEKATSELILRSYSTKSQSALVSLLRPIRKEKNLPLRHYLLNFKSVTVSDDGLSHMMKRPQRSEDHKHVEMWFQGPPSRRREPSPNKGE